MENILQKIAERTRIRIAENKEQIPESVLKEMLLLKLEKEAASGQNLPDFKKALSKPGMSYICEVKKASPSKGLIAPEFPYLEIAREYEEAGASAISCLTEPYWFQGSDRYAEEIAGAVSIPVLRKDFTIDSYMLLQARVMGVAAVLLICAILEDSQLKEYLEQTHELGMHALVEAHDEEEVRRAIKAGAGIIGVNNRDLRTFTVDTGNSIRLRAIAPADRVFVSESGIRTAEDIRALADNGVDAVLIGETLMRSRDKKEVLYRLNGGPLASKSSVRPGERL